jgi:hypothetical protein
MMHEAVYARYTNVKEIRDASDGSFEAFDADGLPVTVDLSALAPDVEALENTRTVNKTILTLESTVTPRRIREMTTVAGAKWVDDVEKLIAIERAKL